MVTVNNKKEDKPKIETSKKEKEVKKSIDGYEIYEEDIEVNIDLNQEIMVTVNNKKEDKPKIETSKKEKEVKRLPVTGM